MLHFQTVSFSPNSVTWFVISHSLLLLSHWVTWWPFSFRSAVLISVWFLMKDRKGLGLDKKGGPEEPEGVEGRKPSLRYRCNKKSCFQWKATGCCREGNGTRSRGRAQVTLFGILICYPTPPITTLLLWFHPSERKLLCLVISHLLNS